MKYSRMMTSGAISLLAIVWIYPFLWMVSASLKTNMDIFKSGLNLIPPVLQLENYHRAWFVAGFNKYMLNSVLVTLGTVLIVLFTASMAGYILGRYQFFGKKVILALIMGAVFVPTGVTIIPTFNLADFLGILDSLFGVIVVLSGSGHVVDILLFTAFFRAIPNELEEAAILDGAGFIRVFYSVMLPMSVPVVATSTILTFLSSWNNFFIPLVFTFSKPELRTLGVGMFAFVGENQIDWSGMCAGATLSLLPLVMVFFLLQKYFISAFAGAIKM